MRRKFETLIDLLQERALERPHQAAYIFLADGESETGRLTYGELNRRAQAIGAWLQSQKAAGTRCILLYPSCLDYIAGFFGCLYGGAVAVPAYPPGSKRTLGRLQRIVSDAEPSFLLTTEAGRAKTDPLGGGPRRRRGLRILATDEIDEGLEERWREPLIEGKSLALLQYTSGSTAAPKGVMLSHANLLFNESLIQKIFQQSEDSVVVGWLPLYHDMGLIGNVLQPVYSGGSCVFMPPSAFLQQPVRWLQAVSRYRATTSGGPNFAYDLCVQKIDKEQRAALDLSAWKVAFNGSEPVRAETLECFAETFAHCGFSDKAFRPCYGLAEGTLIISGRPKQGRPLVRRFDAKALANNRAVDVATQTDDARRVVSCGGTESQLEVIIVDPETRTKCRAGRVGEIWVAGLGVAQGYWNNRPETEQVFRAFLADGTRGPYLRTGDLGFKIKGDLFITGRLKDLIIIRGTNYYPQDIEQTVERAHCRLLVNRGAAFSVEVDGEERVVVLQELKPRRDTDLDEVVRGIRRAVADEHEVAAYAVVLLRPGTIPRTTSGKIQRSACRQAFLSKQLEVLKEWRESVPLIGESSTVGWPPRNETIESWLQSQFALRLGVAPDEISIDRPIAEYCLDSLIAAEMKHVVETKLGVHLSMVSFLQQTTVRQIAMQAAEQRLNQAAPPIEPIHIFGVDRDGQLSPGQRSLWFLQAMAPESPAYNVVSSLRIVSELSVQALRLAFQSLMDRHPALRTTFPAVGSEPVQRIHGQMQIPFAQHDAANWNVAQLDQYIARETHRPFNLGIGPLMRITLFKKGAREHVLLIAIHHIVCDLWSLAVLLEELGSLYQAEISGLPSPLPPVKVSYSDYVRWQEEMLVSDAGERLWSYWQEHVEADLPALDLETDRPRPHTQTYLGASLFLKIRPEITDKLKALGVANASTLYMVLLAAFQVLLYGYTNQEDFAVGSSTAGRTLGGLSRVVGYFVNPVVLRADLSGKPTFEAFLRRVRRVVLGALEHQEFPFPVLVERLNPIRTASLSPLFQTMFVFQKAPVLNDEGMAAFALGEAGARMELGGLVLECMERNLNVAQFDLTLIAAEVNGALSASLQYNTDLFDSATIARMATNLENLLEGIVEEPGRRISLLPFVNEKEQQQQLIEWNDTQRTYHPWLSATETFEQQASNAADAVAVSIEGAELTYAELDKRANQLARYLVGLGVGLESRVGILLERSLEMVIGLLGVLKAGGAYVPLDPEYPGQRLSYMVRDAGVRVLLTQEHLVELMAEESGVVVVCLDRGWEEIGRESGERVRSGIGGENLAYILYTSGSTGEPKGVMVRHESLTNHMQWMQERYPLDGGDCVLQKTALSFDASVWELLAPLLAGARLELARTGGQRESGYLVNSIR